MKLIQLKCTNCNGYMELNVTDGQKMVFCPYCGQKYIMDEEKLYIGVNVNKTERKIDEARIKEAEVREKIRLKELELKLTAQRNRNEGIHYLSKFIASVFLGLIAFISMWGMVGAFIDEVWPAFLLFLSFSVILFYVLRRMWKKK